VTDTKTRLEQELDRGWAYVDRELRTTLERILTPAELDVVKLRAANYGRRRGSLALGISEEAWRYRWRNVIRKLDALPSGEEAA
jgi:DNA-binding CsgD family transcriptional regulator